MKSLGPTYFPLWHSRFIKGVFLGLSLIILAAVIWMNRSTPFRGEHWALLYQMETAQGAADWLRRVAEFCCFPGSRLQPLAFFPVALAYALFGTEFIGHLLLSVLWHLLIGVAFLQLLDGYRTGFKTPFRRIVVEYALEYSLFLVLFAAVDVVTWTFFQYIQIGLLCTLSSLVLYLKNQQQAHGLLYFPKFTAYLLAILATLLYEPFIIVLLVLGGLDFSCAKTRWHSLLPWLSCSVLGGAFFQVYEKQAIRLEPVVGHFLGRTLETGHDVLLPVFGAEKPFFFVAYNYALSLFNIMLSMVSLSQASKVNLYEYNVPEFLKTHTAFWGLGSLLILGLVALRLFRLGNPKLVFLCLILPTLMFSLIALGRTGDGNFPSVQFRYAYILLPFLLVIGLEGLRSIPLLRKCYPQLLAMAFLCNAGSTLDHSVRLSKDMREFANWVESVRREFPDNRERIIRIATGIVNVEVPTRRENLFFTYNGRGGILSVLPSRTELGDPNPYVD